MVWVYRCGLLFGNTVWAASIVLSSFMGGLALGNALAGWYGPRLHRFLWVYAALELTVAITGVGLTYLLGQLPGLLAPFMRALVDVRWLENVVRLGTAFPLLLLPTSAMGATLPVLVGALCRSDARFGPVLGRLYGWNTFGAVSGVAATELVLIARVGVTGSAWVAALFNVGAAIAALSVWSRNESMVVSAPEPAGRVTKKRALPVMWRLLACASLMGGSLMALEVVWFRFLSMFVVASTLAMSLMLAVVLAAIAAGGLLAARWLERRPNATDYLSVVAWMTACTVVAAYGWFQFLTGSTWAAEWYRILWSAIVLTSATAVLSGVAFVLLGAALDTRAAGSQTASAGWLTLANTTGGMLGPLVAAFALLPYAGMERSFFALSAVYAVVGILALRRDSRNSRRQGSLYWSVTTALGAAAALALFPFGLMASTYFPRATAAYEEDGARVVATREGVSETIHLMAKKWLDKPLYYRLVTNGFSMSGTHTSGKRYMRYFAYWPMLFHQAPLHRALIVCYGAGVTTGAVASVKSIDSIDVVEISPDIPALSDIIYPPGDHPLRDPRVRTHVEDGRYFLQETRDRFDLITGEPPPPLTPGTVSLYTREYFQLMHDHLAEGGIVTYWLPVAKRGEYDVKAIIAAFCDVFDDCSLWNGTTFDWMLVGTRHLNGPVSEGSFSAAWHDPSVLPKLQEIGFEVPQEIGATFLADRDELRQLTAGVPPITDNYPQRLRPAATRLSLARGPTAADREMLEFVTRMVDPARSRLAFERSGLVRRLWPQDLALQTLQFFDIQLMINRVMFEGARPLARIEDLHRLLTQTTLRQAPLWMLGSDEAQQEAAASGNDGSGMVEYVLGVRALVARDYGTAAQSFSEAERRGLPVPTVRPLTVYALCLAGRLDAARQLAERVEPTDADQRHFWTWLASTFQVRAQLNQGGDETNRPNADGVRR